MWINGNTLECSPHQLLFHKPCISAGYLRQALKQARIYSGVLLQLSPKQLLRRPLLYQIYVSILLLVFFPLDICRLSRT
jgi:hypothetical protein